jgi:hypothetical protein
MRAHVDPFIGRSGEVMDALYGHHGSESKGHWQCIGASCDDISRAASPNPEFHQRLISAQLWPLSPGRWGRAKAQSTTRDPLLRGRLRRLDEARVDPARFRCRGVGHLHPIAFAADDAKFLALLRDPERLGGLRRGLPHIDVTRELDPLLLFA